MGSHTASNFGTRKGLPAQRTDSDVPAPPHPLAIPDMSAVRLRIQVPGTPETSESQSSKLRASRGLPVSRNDNSVPPPPASTATRQPSIFRNQERMAGRVVEQ